MKDRRLQRLGGAAVSLLVAIGLVVLALDFFFPAQPEPGQSTITQHTDPDGGRRFCGPAEPNDAIMERAREMGTRGAKADDIHSFIESERAKLPPNCVTLGKVPSEP